MASRSDSIDILIGSTMDIARAMRHRVFSNTSDGLHPGQLHAMFIIGEHPGMTMKELAGMLHITSPSATSLVNRVVQMGLVQRKHDTKNRKLVRLRLSKKGAELLKRKHDERNKTLRELFTVLTQAEQAQLSTIHQKLVGHIHSQFLP